jgi:hypothetical protein
MRRHETAAGNMPSYLLMTTYNYTHTCFLRLLMLFHWSFNAVFYIYFVINLVSFFPTYGRNILSLTKSRLEHGIKTHANETNVYAHYMSCKLFIFPFISMLNTFNLFEEIFQIFCSVSQGPGQFSDKDRFCCMKAYPAAPGLRMKHTLTILIGHCFPLQI